MAVTTAGSTFFGGLPSETMVQIFSFLNYSSLCRVFKTCSFAQSLKEADNNYVERAYFSQVQIFDRTHWKKYWRAEITDQFDPSKINIFVLREFLKTYWGPNPVGDGIVKDHCLIPTVLPFEVEMKGQVSNYSNGMLVDLAKPKLFVDPVTKTAKVGRFVKYEHIIKINQSLIAGRMWEAQATEARLVILLKKVVATNKPWSKKSENPSEKGQVQFLENLNAETGYGCETEPKGVLQNTIFCAHYVATGEVCFADEDDEGNITEEKARENFTNGKEYTANLDSRTCETVLNGTNVYYLSSGGSNKQQEGPRLTCSFRADGVDEYIGVRVMKTFPISYNTDTNRAPAQEMTSVTGTAATGSGGGVTPTNPPSTATRTEEADGNDEEDTALDLGNLLTAISTTPTDGTAGTNPQQQ
jgi:hypothetical protein